MTVQEPFPPVPDRPWLKVYRELGVAPAALVYTDKGIEITWAQLDAYANRFANLLRSLGMQSGDSAQ